MRLMGMPCNHLFKIVSLSFYSSPEVARSADFHWIFIRMYLLLGLEVFNRLFIDSIGFMVGDKIMKHLLLGFTQSKYSPWVW